MEIESTHNPDNPLPIDNFYSPSNREFYSSNQYSDLDASKQEIRLLELLAAQDDEPLKLILSSPVSLSPKHNTIPSYCAISYFAGDHKETIKIFVNGIRFNAFANLAYALRQIIRRRKGAELEGCPHLIWADQICINQSNPLERSHQVGFMRKIYESAQVVLACLGEDHYNGHWVKAAKKLRYGTPLDGFQNIQLDQTGIYLSDRHIANFEDKAFQEDWSALGEILSSAWWRRGWIFQEVLVAQNVFLLFGCGTLEMGQFSNAVRICNGVAKKYILDLYSGRMEFLRDFISKLISMKGSSVNSTYIIDSREGWQNSRERNVLELLKYSRTCETTDPRDLVLAFVGLANHGYRIVPDYKSSIAGVFGLACKRIILHETSLNILCHCVEELRREDLPSWVPDWSCEAVTGVVYDSIENLPPFRASADFRSAAAFRSNDAIPDRVLMLQCLFVDQLGTQPSPNTLRDSPSELSFEECERVAGVDYDDNGSKKDDMPYHPDKSLTVGNALWRVLCRGKYTGNERDDDLDIYASTLKSSLESCYVFRSPGGYLSLLSQRAQHTDQICILLGANVPFVLRQVDDHFILIGHAYVEGLMYGEAIKMMKRGELEVETISIY